MEVLFEGSKIKFKDGEIIFEGNRKQALTQFRKLHEKYILDNCENNIEITLRSIIQESIEETLNTELENKYEVYDCLCEEEIEKEIEEQIPCVSIGSVKEDADNLRLYINVWSTGTNAFFKIDVTVTNKNKIDFCIKKGKIIFSE